MPLTQLMCYSQALSSTPDPNLVAFHKVPGPVLMQRTQIERHEYALSMCDILAAHLRSYVDNVARIVPQHSPMAL